MKGGKKTMIKRYYIEETDGKETKRTLTTFNDLDDMRNYSDMEIQEMIYEVSAELVNKSHKAKLLNKELIGRDELGESDFDFKLLREADENIEITLDNLKLGL